MTATVWQPSNSPRAQPAQRAGWGPLARDVARAAMARGRALANADRMLSLSMEALIELTGARSAIDRGAFWQPGERFRVLLAGYNGSRNTGADVRVEEIVRQLRHLFSDELLALSALTLDSTRTRGYFGNAEQIPLPKVFPMALASAVHAHHAVMACEGSMFKSKFANALTTAMVGALGLAEAEGKIGVAYGGEAGEMDAYLRALVHDHCGDALLITRNEASRTLLAELGLSAHLGSDTAWTFEPAPTEVGRRLLCDAGWDGTTPILALCPINPFWWPIQPDVKRTLGLAFSSTDRRDHFGSIYFHRGGAEVDRLQARYVAAIAEAVIRLREHVSVFPVIFGLEQLDRHACTALARALGDRYPVLVSDELDMFTMVSALRQATYMLSSRYHAIVTTMAAGVVSGGITMDERIRNLMADRAQAHLAIDVSGSDLHERTFELLSTLVRDADAIRAGIDASYPVFLRRMGEMGMLLVDRVRAAHPEMPLAAHLGAGGDPWQHLPELPPAVLAVLERAGTTPVVV